MSSYDTRWRKTIHMYVSFVTKGLHRKVHLKFIPIHTRTSHHFRANCATNTCPAVLHSKYTLTLTLGNANTTVIFVRENLLSNQNSTNTWYYIKRIKHLNVMFVGNYLKQSTIYAATLRYTMERNLLLVNNAESHFPTKQTRKHIKTKSILKLRSTVVACV